MKDDQVNYWGNAVKNGAMHFHAASNITAEVNQDSRILLKGLMMSRLPVNDRHICCSDEVCGKWLHLLGLSYWGLHTS